jgi:hypothetical protein
MSDWAILPALLLTFGGLGFAFAGRFLIVLVFVSPIAFWWIWADVNNRGEGDDVTGPVALVGMLLSLGFVLAGVVIRWLVYGVGRWRRAG